MTDTQRATEIRAELFATRVEESRRAALTIEYRTLTGREVWEAPAK